MHVIVNGRNHDIDDQSIDYFTLCKITGHNERNIPSITVSSETTSRSISPGESIDVEENMRFNILG